MQSKIEALVKLIEAHKFGSITLMVFMLLALFIVGVVVEHSIAVVMRNKYNKELLKLRYKTD